MTSYTSTAAMESFFKPHRLYAVTGASADPAKFGHKLLQWYLHRDLPVAGINPKTPTVLGHTAYPSLAALHAEHFAGTTPASGSTTANAAGKTFTSIGVSVVTPPAVSRALVAQIGQEPALRAAVRALWFQPGTYDDDVLAAASALAGVETVVAHGRCVLEDGQYALDGARRTAGPAWDAPPDAADAATKL